jgi:hypothetical protein
LRADQPVWVIIDESGHSDVVRVLLTVLWYRGVRYWWCGWFGKPTRSTWEASQVSALAHQRVLVLA